MFSSSSGSLSAVESALHQEYRHVCEREREAAVRNTRLVEDLTKLKMKIATFSSRDSPSQRLSVLKRQYESYVESNLSDWTSQSADPASVTRMGTSYKTHPPDPVAGVKLPTQRPTPLIVPIREPSSGGAFPPKEPQMPTLPPVDENSKSSPSENFPSVSVQSTSPPREISPPKDISLSLSSPIEPSPLPSPVTHLSKVPPLEPPTQPTDVAPPPPATPTTQPSEVPPPLPATPTTQPSKAPPISSSSLEGSSPISKLHATSEPNLRMRPVLDSKPATLEPVVGMSPSTISNLNVSVQVTSGVTLTPVTPFSTLAQTNSGLLLDLSNPLVEPPGGPVGQGMWDGGVSELSTVSVSSSDASANLDQPLPLDMPQFAAVPGDTSALIGDNSISGLTHTSTEASPPLVDRKQMATPSSESSSQTSLSHHDGPSHSPTPFYSPQVEEDVVPQTSAYQSLLKGALGEGGDNISSSESEASGELTDTNLEKELLQVLEGGGAVKEENPADPVEVPPSDLADEPGDPEGRGTCDEEETSRSVSPEYIPSFTSRSCSQNVGRRGQAPAAMNASLKRRLGLISSDEESDGDEAVDMQLHPSTPASANEEAEFDFLT